MNNKPQCLSCKFWEPIDSGKTIFGKQNEVKEGRCLFNPPVAHPVLIAGGTTTE